MQQMNMTIDDLFCLCNRDWVTFQHCNFTGHELLDIGLTKEWLLMQLRVGDNMQCPMTIEYLNTTYGVQWSTKDFLTEYMGVGADEIGFYSQAFQAMTPMQAMYHQGMLQQQNAAVPAQAMYYRQ